MSGEMELDPKALEKAARALFDEEWYPAARKPKFENDNPNYWRQSARAAITAYLRAAGLVSVPVIGPTKESAEE